jgi:transposase-like protein
MPRQRVFKMAHSKDKCPIARLRYSTGDTMTAISAELSVSTKQLTRWKNADKGGPNDWDKLKAAHAGQPIEIRSNVVPLARKIEAESRGGRGEPQKPLDRVGLLEKTLRRLSDLGATSDDGKEMAAIAGAIVRVDERLEKVRPDTAAAIAARAIDLGISPSDFVQAMRELCQQSA